MKIRESVSYIGQLASVSQLRVATEVIESLRVEDRKLAITGRECLMPTILRTKERLAQICSSLIENDGRATQDFMSTVNQESEKGEFTTTIGGQRFRMKVEEIKRSAEQAEKRNTIDTSAAYRKLLDELDTLHKRLENL